MQYVIEQYSSEQNIRNNSSLRLIYGILPEPVFIPIYCTLFLFEAMSIKQHDYSKQESVPLFGASSCRNTSSSSVIACVSLAAESACVSFFYNSNDHVCHWNCIFLASRSCTTYCTAPWSHYGMWCSDPMTNNWK